MKNIYLYLLFSAACTYCEAQNYVIGYDWMDSTCSGIIYDDGGTSNYTDNFDGYVIIYPDSPSKIIQLTYTSMDLGWGDSVVIYNGYSLNSRIQSSSGSSLPPAISSNHSSGALTVRFLSDSWQNAAGFTASIGCIQPINGVDLTVRNVDLAYPVLAPGRSFSVEYDIYNERFTTSVGSYMKFYLSPDTILDAGDTSIGGYSYVPAVRGYSTYHKQDNLTIPSNIDTGWYYVIIKADGTNGVTETNENNNTAWVLVHILPAAVDLVMSPIQFTPQVSQGETGVVTDTLSNTGTIVNPNTKVGYILSADTIFDGSDLLLDSVQTYSVSPGNSSNLSRSIRVPVNIPLGNYYLLAYVDYAGIIAESDEGNNMSWTQFQVVAPDPDLKISSFFISMQSELVPGTTSNASIVILNRGSSPTISCKGGVYLSSDSLVDNSDTLLISYNIPAMNPSSTYNVTPSFTVPIQVPLGNYYIIGYVDNRDTISEVNEMNNIRALHTLVDSLPYFYIDQLDVVSQQWGSTGDTINVSLQIGNAYRTQTPGGRIAYYIETWYNSNNAILIGVDTFNPMGYSNYTHLAKLIVGDTLVGGSYYLYVCINYDHAIPTAPDPPGYYSPCRGGAYPYYIYIHAPELNLTTNPFLPPSIDRTNVFAGDSVTVTTYTGNYTADTTVPEWHMGYLISNSSGMILLDSLHLPALQTDSHIFVTHSLRIPDTLSAGAYTLYFFSDFDDRIREHDEEDNMDIVGIYVNGIETRPDLSINNVNILQNQVPAGATINFSMIVNNNGNSKAEGFHTGVYLSANTVLDSTDVLLNILDFDSLSAASGYQLNDGLLVPASYPSGGAYLIFYADNNSEVPEIDENNNQQIVHLQIDLASSILPSTPRDLSIRLSPIPATNTIHLLFPEGIGNKVELKIFNAGGTLYYNAKEVQTLENRCQLDVSLFPGGLYILNIVDGDGRGSKMKFEIANH